MKKNPITESIENYLETLWISEERGEDLAKIKWIANHLGVAPPSVIELLKKLKKEDYIIYMPRKGVKLTEKGRGIARRIIRNHRLIEVMMKQVLHIAINHESVCGIEHHMDENFADALCTLLNHPRKCQHGDPIPKGKCCP